MNRSTCASGSGYVPSDSIGFCVAMTRNGDGTGWVSLPIVTCRSCITSSSADCTLAGARLISSASRKLQKTGPSSMSNSSLLARYIRVPTRSAGTRSGVNWTRSKLPPKTSATVFTVSVFARPGTPSIRRWPPASRQTKTRSSISSCPAMMRLISKTALSSSSRSAPPSSARRCPWSVNLAPSWWPAAIQSRLAGEAEARLNRGCELPKRAGGDRAESRTCARVVDSGEAAERDRALGSGASAGRGGQLVDGRVDDAERQRAELVLVLSPDGMRARSASGSRGRRASPRSTRRPSRTAR